MRRRINERRQKESIKLFEISDIYTKDNGIKQQKKFGLIASGRLGNNYIDFSEIRIPYACKLFIQECESMSIYPRLNIE